MKNAKTTITGILTIVAAVLTTWLQYHTTGIVPDLGPPVTAIVAGIGLITARDSRPTDLTPKEQVALKDKVNDL